LVGIALHKVNYRQSDISKQYPSLFYPESIAFYFLLILTALSSKINLIHHHGRLNFDSAIVIHEWYYSVYEQQFSISNFNYC